MFTHQMSPANSWGNGINFFRSNTVSSFIYPSSSDSESLSLMNTLGEHGRDVQLGLEPIVRSLPILAVFSIGNVSIKAYK